MSQFPQRRMAGILRLLAAKSLLDFVGPDALPSAAPRECKRFDAGIVAAAHDLVGVPDDPPSSC